MFSAFPFVLGLENPDAVLASVCIFVLHESCRLVLVVMWDCCHCLTLVCVDSLSVASIPRRAVCQWQL